MNVYEFTTVLVSPHWLHPGIGTYRWNFFFTEPLSPHCLVKVHTDKLFQFLPKCLYTGTHSGCTFWNLLYLLIDFLSF
jgi:hypothetical protein